MSTFNEADHPRHGDGKWAAKELGETDPGFGLESAERSDVEILAEAEEALVRVGDAIAEWESREPHVDVTHGLRWDDQVGDYVEFGRDPEQQVLSDHLDEETLASPVPLSVDDYRTWYGFDPEAAAEDGYRQSDLWSFDPDQLEDWRSWNAHLLELRGIGFNLGVYMSSIEQHGDSVEGAHKGLSETLERAEAAGVFDEPVEAEGNVSAGDDSGPVEDPEHDSEDDWF